MNRANLLRASGVFFIGILILPQATFAAWWSPGSWFKKGQNETLKVEAPVEATSSPALEKATVKQVAPQVIHDTKIVEKPVIKTVTVQDPSLQKQINDLIADNALLKARVEELTRRINEKEEELQLLRKTPVFSKAEECKKAQEILDAYGPKINEIVAREKVATAEIIEKAGNSGGTITQKDVDAVKNKFKVEKSAAAKEMSLAKTKRDLYCE